MSVAALKAGKHVACTVPMATSVEECWQIIEAVKSSGKKIYDGGDSDLFA